MRQFFTFLLFSQIALASLSAHPGAKMGVRGGIRKNRIDTTFKQTLHDEEIKLSEKYKDMRLREVQAFVHIIWPRLFAEFEGSYGWFDRGKIKVEQEISYDALPLDYYLKARGEQLSLTTLAGVPLKWSKFLYVAPIVGYAWDRHEIKRYDVNPDPIILNDATTSDSLSIFYEPSEKDLVQRWEGPLFGAQINLSYYKRHSTTLRYTYHLMNVVERNRFSTELVGKDASGSILFETDIFTKRKSSVNGKGHHFTYRWASKVNQAWDFGFALEYLLYFSDFERKAKIETTKISTSIPEEVFKERKEPIKFKWESFAVLFEISRRF